jgi:hypothetical protein
MYEWENVSMNMLKREEKNIHDHFTCLNANNQSMILMWANDGWRRNMEYKKKTSITQSQAVQGE